MTRPPGRATPYVIVLLFALSLVVLAVATFVDALARSDLTNSTGPEGGAQLVLAFANFAWIGLSTLGFGLERKKLVDFGFWALAANLFFWLFLVMATLG